MQFFRSICKQGFKFEGRRSLWNDEDCSICNHYLTHYLKHQTKQSKKNSKDCISKVQVSRSFQEIFAFTLCRCFPKQLSFYMQIHYLLPFLIIHVCSHYPLCKDLPDSTGTFRMVPMTRVDPSGHFKGVCTGHRCHSEGYECLQTL